METDIIEGLFAEIERKFLNGADRHVDVAMPGDQNDRPRISALVEMPHQIETGHARHPHVGNDAIELLAAIERFQKIPSQPGRSTFR